MVTGIIFFIAGLGFGVFISCLIVAKGRSEILDSYIFSADQLVIDNGAIILKDNTTGKEAYKRLNSEDAAYLQSIDYRFMGGAR